MNLLKSICGRVRALFQKEKLDREKDEELRFHIDRQTEANTQAGMKPEEARYAALRKFGWMESIREACRDVWGVRWLEDLSGDARFPDLIRELSCTDAKHRDLANEVLQQVYSDVHPQSPTTPTNSAAWTAWWEQAGKTNSAQQLWHNFDSHYQ